MKAKQFKTIALPASERLIITRKTARGEEHSIIVNPGSLEALAFQMEHRAVLPSSILRVDGLDRIATPELEQKLREGKVTREEFESLKVWPVMEHVSLHVRSVVVH